MWSPRSVHFFGAYLIHLWTHHTACVRRPRYGWGILSPSFGGPRAPSSSAQLGQSQVAFTMFSVGRPRRCPFAAYLIHLWTHRLRQASTLCLGLPFPGFGPSCELSLSTLLASFQGACTIFSIGRPRSCPSAAYYSFLLFALGE